MKRIRKLSIVVPVYNEEKTIGKILKKIYEVDFGKINIEVIVVNDGSKDDTLCVLEILEKKYPIKIVSYKKNLGKGWALRNGFKKVTGDVVTIQDGDLEYSPRDFIKMLEKISETDVRVVYGSRCLNKKNINYSGLGFYIGGLLLTYMTNILYGSQITDESTCYKMFEKKLIKSIKLEAKGFNFCPEVTAKILRQKIEIHEVPINYHPRNVTQGKKIKLNDFFEAVWALVKYRTIE